MIDALTSNPYFGLAVTLLCWHLAVRFQKKTGQVLFNPILVASLLVILFLTVFRIPVANYRIGGDLIKGLLGPATAVLALNIYRQKAILKAHFWPVVLGCFVGSLTSIAAVFLLCRLLGTDQSILCSLLPKSVTNAIAVSISENIGGFPGLTALAVCVAGLEGAILAPLFAKIFHVTDPVAEGVAIGACSHAAGTAQALKIGPLQGAMSSIALCVCGIITSVLIMFIPI